VATERENISFDYTNWRGEKSRRRVHPIRIYFANTPWHPNTQWLMEGYDLDKKEMRDYALADMSNISRGPE
jgi:predicted DNA-binding transcriptional regulator YafY